MADDTLQIEDYEPNLIIALLSPPAKMISYYKIVKLPNELYTLGQVRFPRAGQKKVPCG